MGRDQRTRWIRLLWSCCYPPTAVVVVRLVYEQTLLTRLRGPQMVGFSLAHSFGALLLVFGLSVLATHLWLLAVLSWRVVAWIRRLEMPFWAPWRTLATAVTLSLLYVPYGAWQYVQIRLLGPGEHGAMLLVEGAGRGDVGLVKELLAQGVEVDAQSSDGDTALRGAATAGRAQMVRYLLSRGADPNRAGGILSRTPLMNAAEMGHREVAELLLAGGADPTLTDARGRTALMIAEAAGHSDIAERLRSASR